jgi:hypothetical protein
VLRRCQQLDYIAPNGAMTDEWRIAMEVATVQSKYSPSICPEVLRKTTKILTRIHRKPYSFPDNSAKGSEGVGTVTLRVHTFSATRACCRSDPSARHSCYARCRTVTAHGETLEGTLTWMSNWRNVSTVLHPRKGHFLRTDYTSVCFGTIVVLTYWFTSYGQTAK